MLTPVLGLLVELSSHCVKKYPTLGPPLIVRSTPIVPVLVPELSHKLNGVASDAVPEDTPARYMAVGCDEGRPFVWMVNRYCVCQFQVMVEAAVMVNATLPDDPVGGTLPVPVQPVVMN